LAAADRASAIFEVLSTEDPNDARAALDVAGILMRRGRCARPDAEPALICCPARTEPRRSPDSTRRAAAAEALDGTARASCRWGGRRSRPRDSGETGRRSGADPNIHDAPRDRRVTVHSASPAAVEVRHEACRSYARALR
jgi:hypothetical protein